MIRAQFLIISLLLTLPSTALQNHSATAPEAEVEKLLHDQVDAWNRHDLEGFMKGYWKSPELTFFSIDTVTRGWQPTLERYRKKYQSGGADMDKLEFSDLQITVLSDDSAFARGRWQLTMKDGRQPHGLFTLVLRKLPEGWRIVHDHTSAAP